MTTVACALCDRDISKLNNTEEHVIPNAIGGRKTVSDFICNDCNNKTGEDWESALARQLNPLSLFFGINRKRGSSPSQEFYTTGGDKLRLNADGSMDIIKPKYEETKTEAGVKITINDHSMEKVKHRLKGVQRRFPHASLDELMDNIQEKSSYSSDMLKLDLSFGGQDAGRSIVKSALALAVESGVDPRSCEHAREYLLNDSGKACFGYYYENDLIRNRPEGVPLHCVYIKGDLDSKQLLGYVEYFGIQRIVTCLSSVYEGNEFTDCYAINPISGKEIDIVVDLNLSPDDIQAAYNGEKIPKGAIEAVFNKVVPAGIIASYDKELDRVMSQAVQYAYSDCGAKEGENLTLEQFEKFRGLVWEKLEPFILHQITQAKKRNT